MPRKAAVACWTPARAWARAVRCCVGGAAYLAVALLAAISFSAAGRAQPVKGDAALTVAGGHARLVLKLSEDVESDVSVAGTILVVRFKRPVDIGIDKLSDAAPDYIGSARRDPDGSALRFALSRKVTVNAMAAGERIFVDLLPETWKGLPPGLPQDVVRELSERARIAERELRQQRAAAEVRKRPPIRLRASVQPTFVRFVIELPDGVSASSNLSDSNLVLTFGAGLTFDLADAKLSAPPNIASIGQAIDGNRSAIEIALIGDVDVHSFREDRNYVVDVGFQQTDRPVAQPGFSAAVAQPIAAKIEAPEQPAAAPAAPSNPGEAAPPTSFSAPPRLSEPPADQPADKTATAVEVKRSSDSLRLNFAFAAPTPAALFRRGDIMWLVIDATEPIDVAAIRRDGGSIIADASRVMLASGQAIRMRLNRPQLASLMPDDAERAGLRWSVTFADIRQAPSQPLAAIRNMSAPAPANVVVPLAQQGAMHKLTDPDAGDAFTVVTALPPPRGFIRRQDFVEFSLLESVHGVVIQLNSDDVTIDAAPDKLTLTRPGGLTLSPSDTMPQRTSSAARPIFDIGQWRRDQEGSFVARLDTITRAAAGADPSGRAAARIDLARFYMARGMYYEAKGVADLALSGAKPGQENPVALIVHAVASALIGRPGDTLKDIANPVLGPSYNSELWKALAYARQGKWVEARERFKNSDTSISSLPVDLQRIAITQAWRASLEVKDYADAAARANELELVGIPPEMKPSSLLLGGWLDDALGRDKDALSKYRQAAASADRQAGAEAKLRELALLEKRHDIRREDSVRELETLSVMWRGDGIEVQALQRLSQLYSSVGRYRESLMAARDATERQSNSDSARQVQDEASVLFSQIFLSSKGDDLPPVDALAMFYEFRELTPIGRRGDEMIRRLADRLVAVDLLDQASELLQYQVDHRLEGAARSQVAARLAMVYLMNRKPERAISALRTTRIADLAGELRQQRLLLEARAQGDIGRRDLALDIISNIGGREAIRLRSDIYWLSRRWREASEQIELYYADRWRDFTPLSASEKSDMIRAVVGYALAEDKLGLARFRDKYAPLMTGEADRIAFDTASRPTSTNSSEFAAIAKLASSTDTLDGFLRDMKVRFPDVSAKAALPQGSAADLDATGSLPAASQSQNSDAVK